MRTTYTSKSNPAASWSRRRQAVPNALRGAVAGNARLVAQARLRLMQETIYDRPPTGRPLSGRLKRGEFVQAAGNAARVGNRASYAGRRNAMSGISRTDGHQLDSHWAQRSVGETRAARIGAVRAALRRAGKAGGA